MQHEWRKYWMNLRPAQTRDEAVSEENAGLKSSLKIMRDFEEKNLTTYILQQGSKKAKVKR
jgi:hypothetical protein